MLLEIEDRESKLYDILSKLIDFCVHVHPNVKKGLVQYRKPKSTDTCVDGDLGGKKRKRQVGAEVFVDETVSDLLREMKRNKSSFSSQAKENPRIEVLRLEDGIAEETPEKKTSSCVVC